MNRNIIQRLKIFGWIALVGLSVVLVFSSVQQKQKSFIQDIDISIVPLKGEDSTLINEKDVLETLQNSFAESLLGSELGQINVQRIERVLEKNAFVKAVNAYLDAKNVINISIEQRKPIIRVQDVEGRDYYLDAIGSYMPTSKHYTARVLVVTGYVTPFIPDFRTKKENGLNEVFQLVTMLKADPFYDALIEQLHVSQERDIILVPKLGRQKILFGKYRKEASKLKRLKIFYKQGLPYEGWEKYKQIDVRFDNQIVCKK